MSAFVLFANGAPGPLFGRVAIERLAARRRPSAGGTARLRARALCRWYRRVRANGRIELPARSFAEFFDASFKRTHVVPLTGSPIRARVSPDGRRAALTVFETGHSYADA